MVWIKAIMAFFSIGNRVKSWVGADDMGNRLDILSREIQALRLEIGRVKDKSSARGDDIGKILDRMERRQLHTHSVLSKIEEEVSRF